MFSKEKLLLFSMSAVAELGAILAQVETFQVNHRAKTELGLIGNGFCSF